MLTGIPTRSYNGRIEHGEAKLEGKTVEQNTAGGLTFAMLEAHDLTVDRAQYLREREEDEMTISTATALGRRAGPQSVAGTDVDDYFSDARAEYLKHGVHPSQSSTPFYPGTPDELPSELQRMPTFDDATPGTFYGLGASPNPSTEHLIHAAPAYPPSYSSPGRGPPGRDRAPSASPRIGGAGGFHRGNPSQTSLSSVGGGAAYYAQPADVAQYGLPRPSSRGETYGSGARAPPARQQPSRQGTFDPQEAFAVGNARGAPGNFGPPVHDPYARFSPPPTNFAPLQADSTEDVTSQVPRRR